MVSTDPQASPCPPRLEAISLAGREVNLRPLADYHAGPLADIVLADPALWRWMPIAPASRSEVMQPILQAIAEGRETGLMHPFVVLDSQTGHPIGSTRFLDYRPAHRGVEIGWTWYARSAWGTRVNPEAKLLLMEYAFQVLGCVRVQLKTDARNERSRAAILKLGAQQEGILRRHQVTQSGRFIRDSVYFSVLDDEWPAVREGLLARIEEGD